MQGRITKVLNMKPPEILGLLEEAAGTKMYEILAPISEDLTIMLLLCSAKEQVEAAQNELAGAEAGDGRDASNRSLQEQLATAQNSQVLPISNFILLNSRRCCNFVQNAWALGLWALI